LLLPPRGIQTLNALQQAVGLAADFFGSTFDVSEYDPARAQAVATLRFAFAPIRHFIPGFALRFEANERTLVYSSDTGWSQNIIELAHGANLALIEATLLSQSEDTEGHLTAAQAGALARQAQVQRLVLTHYWEAQAGALRREAAETFGAEVVMAQPLQRLPV
jgi:ribonuclease BN (tRNA processing enzyme)